ncbi:MAG: hypothetical protein QOI34_1036 [Verrucomicrobiota bacterium]|jgi:hypothetical protein
MFVNIPSAKLKKLVKLSQRKEALLAQIQEIDRDMLRLEREFGHVPGEALRKGRFTFSVASKNKSTLRRPGSRPTGKRTERVTRSRKR